MSKYIAVFLNEDEQTISFDKSGVINVYIKEKDNWNITKSIIFNPSDVKNLKDMREKFIQLAKDLEECKILVANQVTGVPYNVLDTLGFNLWEMEGNPEGFLEYILENEENDKTTTKVNNKTYPVAHIKDGYYYINLKELQETNSGISSKQALLPFLRNNDFYELEIICSHMPPWFEGEFERLSLKSNIVRNSANEYKVIVYRKTCSE